MRHYIQPVTQRNERMVAYFSMEIGLDASIPTYSGGLGILAGDTIKSCADLRIPIVGMTLLSEKGYFCQKLDLQGNQTENPCVWNPRDMMKLMPEKVIVEIEKRSVVVQAWEYNVKGVKGYEVPVYFLDTNMPENSEYDRTLTSYLYGGDTRYRLAQEIVLGIGGVRMLSVLGYSNLQKFHLNEGHSSLLILELIRRCLTGPDTYDYEKVLESCVFTTHTPVPAGHDKFPAGMVGEILGQFLPEKIMECIWHEGMLNMTFLALNHAGYINGVAKRHGEVSRDLFPGYPIDSITNGIHSPTWTSEPFRKLYDRHIPGWTSDAFALRYALKINRHEIWEAHMESKRALIKYVNDKTGAGMDPDVLTIGFARRATMYKRPYLIFQDIGLLTEIAETTGKIQIIFGGKAHPRDTEGKDLIRKIHENIAKLRDKVKVVYLENYDIDIAKLLTSGVDVWLNTPLKPYEASGTSGMKACHNGIPNFSVLDGWWVEGHIENVTGWSIGPKHKREHKESITDDARDADDLYDKLQNVIVPMFYNDWDRWTEIMRHSIAFNASFFNTHRMVHQYVLNAYFH